VVNFWERVLRGAAYFFTHCPDSCRNQVPAGADLKISPA
jgi:hypothetical protein